MATYIARTQGTNDGQEESVLDGGMETSSSDHELGVALENSNGQIVGLWYDGVTIPKGAVIDFAYIQFHVDEITGTNAVDVDINAEADDDYPIFETSNGSLTAGTFTTETVNWDIPDWDTVHDEGIDQRSADISLLVQALVDRAGWDSGQAMAFYFSYTSGSFAGGNYRTAESFDGESAAAPELNIGYTVLEGFSPFLKLKNRTLVRM